MFSTQFFFSFLLTVNLLKTEKNSGNIDKKQSLTNARYAYIGNSDQEKN